MESDHFRVNLSADTPSPDMLEIRLEIGGLYITATGLGDLKAEQLVGCRDLE